MQVNEKREVEILRDAILDYQKAVDKLMHYTEELKSLEASLIREDNPSFEKRRVIMRWILDRLEGNIDVGKASLRILEKFYSTFKNI